MKVVDMSSAMLDRLTTRAESSPRRRQHHNLHATHADPVQRLFNAVDVDSYIRPHRHWQDPKAETLLGIRGTFTFVTFDDAGKVVEAIEFGEPEPRRRNSAGNLAHRGRQRTRCDYF
jgi:cupin fold WbuC family metalloprotein